MVKREYLNKDDMQYLTVKERKTLKILLKNGRATNVHLGKRLKISPQVAGRIRRKLKENKVIKNYKTEIDYYKLGIKVFAFVLFDIKNSHEEKVITPNLINFYRIVPNSATHIGLYGFKNSEELSRYFHSLETEYDKYIKIKEIHTFPANCLFKHSAKGLFLELVIRFGKKLSRLPKIIPKNIFKEVKLKETNLSVNERWILKAFLKESRTSCGKISSQSTKSKITRGGVNRIKRRLENKKVIRGYTVILDYEKLGINILAFILISRQPSYWDSQKAMEMWCDKCPHIMGGYKLSTSGFCVLYGGFRDIKELEQYCDELQTKNEEIIKIEKIFLSSPKGAIRESPTDLFLSILEKLS